MLRRALIAVIVSVAVSRSPSPLVAATPILYRFSFPEPQHHWMQVEVTLRDLDPRMPLELRMSRSSPGRYSLHEFAKNVYDVHVQDDGGHDLATTRPDPSGWTVPTHGSTVVVRYRIFGDTLDGTYLAIDTTHAHINMPAAIMWARGLDERPSTLTFEEPPGFTWQVATQLHASSDLPSGAVDRRFPTADRRSATPDRVFTAPNLQYLMDSPVEFGPITMREFAVAGRRFRFALHHTGTDAELDAYVRDVEKIVGQEGAIFGEYPQYEPGSYTFLADYLPYASFDGMEHRNSTVMTGAASLRNRQDADRMLETVAHEFFHCWNVERIRPRSLEPFDFDRANMSNELWLAEGFTQYYGELVMRRAGVVDDATELAMLSQMIEAVALSPGREVRSAVGMSRMAPFTDGERPVDRTDWTNTVISYYPFGGAIALALDLTLRERTDSRITLDDYMRSMWQVFGRPGGTREGYVDHPYTVADAEARLADLTGDARFARDFFARFVEGHDIANYADLLVRAGVVLRKRSAGEPWIGDIRYDTRNGVRIAEEVASNTPAYAAGLDEGVVVRQFGGERVTSPDDIEAVLRRRRPGDRVEMVFGDRRGSDQKTMVTLGENPHLELVPAESAGVAVTPSQRTLREAWLGPRPALRPTQPPQR